MLNKWNTAKYPPQSTPINQDNSVSVWSKNEAMGLLSLVHPSHTPHFSKKIVNRG
jgi:hypothetical protein